MALATAPAHDPDLDRVISAEVAADLVTKVAGKRLAATRRPPRSRSSAAWSARAPTASSTWQIGRYADRELLPRARR